MNKKIWQSKTLWLAIIQGVAGVITVLATEAPTVGWVLVSKSMIDVILRLLTTQPVGGV